MNYSDAIKHIETVDIKDEFYAITYNKEDSHFYVYTLSGENDPEEGIRIHCHVEGGIVFDTDGVEDYLSIDEARSSIADLHFKPLDQSLSISGMVAEHVLFTVFPTLPDPETLWTKKEKLAFLNSAKHKVEHEWDK